MRLWPRSLRGQLLLTIALALFVAQGLSAALIYRAQTQRLEAAMVDTAAFRLAGGPRRHREGPPFARPRGRRMGVQLADRSPQRPGEQRAEAAERALARILSEEDVAFSEVVVVERRVGADPLARRWVARHHARMTARHREPPQRMLVAGIRRGDGRWLHARVFAPGGERALLSTLLVQTVFIYALLVGAVALLLRRITRPLAALAARVERFSETRDSSGQLEPQGPDDVRRLIAAHNALEGRIVGLLDEKDVMLGAIGHDLKTPLAALRVRIESVADDAERARMAAVIEDINRSLDDILTLARVGRPGDPLEPTELGALAAAVVEEYEDRGEPVTLLPGGRLVAPARVTWLRRLLRNLVDNALRYGGAARVAVERAAGQALIRVEDDGPGIPEAEIARMLEPFTRLEASRSKTTGGAGLGLTLARAIAEQHGGTLTLANRREGERVAGLTATVKLPLA